MIPLRDLTVRNDVKGGSPKSPSVGIPVAEYQQYAMPVNGNGVWKSIACGLAGLVVGLIVALFNSMQTKGVTARELQEYVEKYSPYSQQKEVIAQHFMTQDRLIGELQGKQDRAFDRLNKTENEVDKCNLAIQALAVEVRSKMGTVADMLEKAKK